jgi:hypothetical protein
MNDKLLWMHVTILKTNIPRKMQYPALDDPESYINQKLTNYEFDD